MTAIAPSSVPGRPIHGARAEFRKERDVVRHYIAVWSVFALVAAACGKRVPEPTGVAPGTPHISWVIMTGDRDSPDREFVCQSDPKNDCVVDATRPDDQRFSDVHFYYHGAGAETKYTGSIQIGFFEGAAESHVVQPNITVKKNEEIANQSILGIVSSKPGRFAITFDLVATTDTGKTQTIRTDVPIVVR
jgi:hypothetical protein